MKLTSIIILTACLQVSARGYSQKVTLTRTNVSLVDVFQEIQKQTGYNFLYTYEELEGIGPVSINLHDVSLQDALESCLHEKPLTFSIVEKTVVIKPKAGIPAAATASPVFADTVRGYVLDSTGAPLIGASITIKGTKDGTKTDNRGRFGLIQPKTGTVIIISYLGYYKREIVIGGALPTPFNIYMQRSDDALDATIIQAYGTTSRRFNVGSISTVNSDVIEAQPVTNVLLALEGQAPGLNITATSGVPGSRVAVQVRGQNTLQSLTGGLTAVSSLNPGLVLKPYDQPLFIVDGVPFAPQNTNVNQLSSLAQQSQFTGGLSQAGGISPFATINPADIESITILKDADATSIYGTQGSNGVILITTKKGKVGKTQFDLTANTGFNSVARPVKMMNTPEYINLRQTALAQDSLGPASSNPASPAYAPDLTLFSQTKYTNWEKIIYGNTTNNTDVHASLTGGSAANNFILSGGYTRSTFNYPGDFSDQRWTMHSNFHHASTDNRLTMDFGVDFGYDQNNSASNGGARDVLLPPNLPDLKNPDGSLIWSYQGYDLRQLQFYSNLLQPSYLSTYNLNNSLHLNYKILTGLSFTVSAGYSRNTSSESSKNPSIAQEPPYFNRNATFAQTNFQTINIEPQLDYNLNFGRSAISALVGATYKQNTSYDGTQQGNGYASDQLLGSIDGAATVSDYDNSTLYRYDAGFGRIKYIYNREFILSLTGRRDGSSNFGPGRQFGSFGSVGGGWIFTQEKALANAIPFLSYGKLSGSYGTSGSDGVAPYMYQAYWEALGRTTAFQGTQPDRPTNLSNPDYSWATKKSLNVGMDLGFIHDRLLVNATYYRDREGNQLGNYPLPITAGFGGVTENLPANVQNSGWEFTLTSSNVKTKNFTWNSNFNISFNRNKLLSFPNLANSSYSSLYVIGKPTSIVFGWKYKDVNPTTGLFEFYDAKGEATSNPSYLTIAQGGDLQPIANQEVKFMGGFGNTLTYKKFSLYLFFQFSSMTAPNYLYTMYGSYWPGFPMFNQPTFIQGKYWTGPGDTHATLQRLSTGYGSPSWSSAGDIEASNAAYTDDSYIRLKTVSLSYALPNEAMKHLHMNSARIFCNVQNLLTLTDYKVGDPESGLGNYTNFPVQRIVAFGLNCNF